jgi:F-type H+-transporting ATPase subunit b
MPQLELHDFAPQLIWLAITFVTLYLVMARVALPRIANVIEERRDRIASDLDKAAQLKEETELAIKSYKTSLADAKARAHEIAQKAREEIGAEIDGERQAAEKVLAEKIAVAEKKLGEAKADAIAHVDDIAAEITCEMVEVLLGKRPDAKEVARVVKL